MNLRVLDPTWFFVLAAAIPLGVIGVRWLRAMSAGRRWASILMRVALLALAAGALAGATLIRTIDRLCVIAVVDVSGSVQRLFDPGMSADSRPIPLWDRLRPVLDAGSARRLPDDTSAVIAFGSDAAVIAAPQGAPQGVFISGSPDLGGLSTRAGRGTNIAEVLRLAGAVVPPGAAARVVLISDGVPTSGETAAAIAELGRTAATASVGDGTQSGPIPIDTVCLSYRVDREVIVESVESPAAAPGEATVQVRVTLSSATQASGTLELSREGEAVDINGAEAGTRRAIRLDPGRTTLLLPVRLPAGRVHRFEAIFTAQDGADTMADNNRAESVTLTPGRSSVLLIDGVGGGDRAPVLARPSRGRSGGGGGVEVEMISPESVLSDLLWLQRYDLIVLQNIAADALGGGVNDALATYVTRFGGGLVMVGGPDSFGAGGWKGTPIEPILPVVLDLPERLVSPAAAVVIILDCSGSMGFRVMGTGRTQQQIANEGAAAAVEAVDKSDLLGVIIFNESHDVLVPLGPNSNPKASADKVRSIIPDGGTNLPPALTEAHRQLRAATADIKHVIVLSDGVSMGAKELPGMCEAIKNDNIRVTTIAVGDRADAAGMAQMAARGDGTFFMVTDPTLLPRIFIKAVRIIRSPQVREIPFVPRLLATGSPLIDGLSEPLPSLNGLVLTQARLERGVLTPISTPTGEPVLAHWSAGVGRVGAFTSDAHKWARPWLDWPGYTRMWTQVVRGIARPQPDRGQELMIEIDGDTMRVRVLASDADGRPRDGLSISGWVHGSDNSREQVTLVQTGPGEYEAAVKDRQSGSEGSRVVTLTPSLNGKPMPPLVGGVSRAVGAEFRRLSSDEHAMAELARQSGGRVIALPKLSASPAAEGALAVNLFDRSTLQPTIARTPLWHALLIAVIAIYILDVGCRRVAWDRLFSREFGRSLGRAAAASVQERGERAARAVGRLKQTEELLDSEEQSAARAGSTPAKLSDEDAKAVIKAQQERRRQLRAAAKAQGKQQKASGDVSVKSSVAESERLPHSDTAPIEAAPSDELGQPSSLLEAKRRARKRMDDDQA